ncbi:MAG: B12-binding domain-containing radical SAM protein, partial [bacterium]|nr:B12-binding domain-containing radical SAM protein [bacterium]
SRQAIYSQDTLTQNDYAETLPFERRFTLRYQADFLNDYFLNRERLLHVLPYQMKIMTEDEIIQKYNNYLPAQIERFNDILDLAGIDRGELGEAEFVAEESVRVHEFNRKLKDHFTRKKPAKNALKLVLLDLSQQFSHEKNVIYDVVEFPLGYMYLLTNLNKQLGDKIDGKIVKSGIDFDNYRELQTILEDIRPDIIGVRTLTFYKEFFHKSISKIRDWGFDVPIIAGGPYPTTNYNTIIQDRGIDIIVVGEGEATFCELMEKIVTNK